MSSKQDYEATARRIRALLGKLAGLDSRAAWEIDEAREAVRDYVVQTANDYEAANPSFRREQFL